ncbi:DUF5689 domain-containing protein [uncultured Alistipes sp.]|uniref:DUF5689 domain-containing protein n=1 Tax=uncultured Alistipes sp. TaxID=538949 RepID=UPI00262C4610|nr:DUF5689 domain-containing protein [uncultured Alistipes sp.]
MPRLALFLLAALALGGCYDSAETPSVATNELPATTATLAELHRMYAGTTVRIESDIVVAGRVTSHDRAGNFYRSLVFEEEEGAAELMAGFDGLHALYPVGCRIAVNLNGLAVGESHGVLQLGLYPAAGSGYATDYIGSRPALERSLARGSETSPLRPLVCERITALRPDMAGRLVRVDGVRFAPEGDEPATWSGMKRFTDADGYVVHTYTRPYADFADREIPDGELLLVGILQCDPASDGSCRYTLRMRDEKDCWF